ncbi:hypothetical protein H4R20_005621 [Coemansia guatemalensis]|uniref:Uncharacterized protein n=1 Tax=Coemansia guatemalensis TaxID=2761395 RepID=A0A9W8HRD1_9FUNG|nr:hypothetical protein H4R20_005621 [Coemansia guatemalensis]
MDPIFDNPKDYVAERSIRMCEQQLENFPFTEPLDAYQIQRLTEIEDAMLWCSTDKYDLEDRISAIQEEIQPWLLKKYELVEAAKKAAKRSNNDHAEEAVGAGKTTAETHGQAAGDYSSQKSDVSAGAGLNYGIKEKADDMAEWSAQGRRQSLAAKREELLGEAQSLRRRGVVPDSVEGVERLLQSQRETHEELTSELSKMSGALKANSMAFGSLVERDKELVEETSEMLGRSASGVGTQGARLNKYRKRAWGTTGMTWLAVLVVVAVFFMLVLFMRVAPKRY